MRKLDRPIGQWYLALILGFLLTTLTIPGAVLAVNLLINGPFESFQSYNGQDWRGFPEKYGQGWTVQVLDEDGLHFMDSDTFGHFATAVYGVPFLNYKLEGNFAQAFASRHHYNFVFSQTVTVDSGHDYAFGGKLVTFWKGSGGEVDHTKIFKRIGLDPTGDEDYSSPNVIWTDWDGTDNAWISPALATTAQAGQMTVFIQVENIADDVGAAYLNTAYMDNFKFELAPVATLNLPDQAAPGLVAATWSVDIPDPGFWTLWGYDVEYKNEADGVWQTIQTHSGADGRDTGFVWTAQAGHSYTFRVRPWQERPGGDAATTALPGLWQEKSITIGQAVTGRVINHAGLGLSGVTVAISGAAMSTLSAGDGYYALPTGAVGTFEVAAADFNGLVAPPATGVTVPAADAVGELTITLRPGGAAQPIANNDFEADLSAWQLSDGTAAGASNLDRHTGQRSLLISNSLTISQTGVVSGMRQPLLSFWYKNDADFSVEFLGAAGANPLQPQAVSPVQTQTLNPVGDWTYFSLELGAGEVYTGEIGVNFSYSGGAGANIFIDEVSIGPGFSKTYLPIMLKN